MAHRLPAKQKAKPKLASFQQDSSGQNGFGVCAMELLERITNARVEVFMFG